MQASGLFAGYEYVLRDSDETVTVLDPAVQPDGTPNQRKVLVLRDGAQEYILPKQIDRPAPSGGERRVVTKRPADLVPPVTRQQVTDWQVSQPVTIDDPRLDVLRPDPSVVSRYVNRIMPNGDTDVQYFMKKWRKREPVLIVGETQSGKTMLVQVLAVLCAIEMGLDKPLPVFTLSASNGITDFDLFGQPTAWTDPDTGIEHIVWLPGIVDMAARIGGFLYLDELNMMPERVTSSLHPVCDWRGTFTNRAKAVKVPNDGFMPEMVRVSKDLWIIGTMNVGYRGAGALNEAFSNRFRHIDWPYDPRVEAALIPNVGVRALAEALRNAKIAGNVQTPIGTAALMRCCEDVDEDGAKMALFCIESMFTDEDERAKVKEILDTHTFEELLTTGGRQVPQGADPW